MFLLSAVTDTWHMACIPQEATNMNLKQLPKWLTIPVGGSLWFYSSMDNFCFCVLTTTQKLLYYCIVPQFNCCCKQNCIWHARRFRTTFSNPHFYLVIHFCQRCHMNESSELPVDLLYIKFYFIFGQNCGRLCYIKSKNRPLYLTGLNICPSNEIKLNWSPFAIPTLESIWYLHNLSAKYCKG